MADGEVCGNCGRVIGKLETAHVWGENVVCGPCLAVLRQTPPAPPVVPQPSLAELAASARPPVIPVRTIPPRGASGVRTTLKNPWVWIVAGCVGLIVLSGLGLGAFSLFSRGRTAWPMAGPEKPASKYGQMNAKTLAVYIDERLIPGESANAQITWKIVYDFIMQGDYAGAKLMLEPHQFERPGWWANPPVSP
jgi:hypothetical protein